MSSDRPSGKRDIWGPIGIVITILTTGATIVVRFSALEEAKTITVEHIRDHESRISYIERNNALLERIHNLEKQNVEIQTELTNLRDELRETAARKRR